VRFTLAVKTHRGELLTFNTFGRSEYLTAVAIARHTSHSAEWVEVWDEDDNQAVLCRYKDGYPADGSPSRVWMDNTRSYQRHRGAEIYGLPEWSHARGVSGR
jgi:hypothetical protein